MLEIRKINKSFPQTNFVLKDITCNLNIGLNVLAGPNGSGKSTLLRLAAGISKPNIGTILYQAQDINANPVQYKYKLGYLPQKFAFYSHMTGMDYLLYLANLKGIFGRFAKIQASYVADVVSISEHCSKKISTWSIGLRQRLGIAQALLNDPDILILDEPLCALAFEESIKIKNLLYQLASKKVILMSSHLIDDLPISRLLLLAKGTLKFNGLPSNFIDQANGNVWAAAATKECWQDIQSAYPNSTAIFTENSCLYRIISDNKPTLPNIQSVLPSLEEAYLIWLRNLSKREANI